MTIALSPAFGAGWQFFTDDGIPLAGGKLYSFAAGTTTPAPTYTSITGSTANSNPIVLDAAGRVVEEIWVTVGSSYKFTLKDALGVEIWTKDNISIFTGVDVLPLFADTTNPALGDNMVGYRQSNAAGLLTGAVGKTVHDKFQEFVSVKDFGAVGDGLTDDTAALVLALKEKRNVHFPAGIYRITACVELLNMESWSMTGDGIGATTIRADATGTNFIAPRILMFYISNCNRWTISGITFDGNQSTKFVNNKSDTMYVTDSDQWQISHCEFIHHPRAALYAISVTYFTVEACTFYFDYPDGNNNYNCTIDSVISNGVAPSPATDSLYGLVTNNLSIGGQTQVRGRHISVIGNTFNLSTYGCGLLIGGSMFSGDGKEYWGWYLVANNRAMYNTGLDSDGVHVRGLEAAGLYNIITGNNFSQNGGVGILNFGGWATITGNTCCGNGSNVTVYPGMSVLDRVGISLYQYSGTGPTGRGASVSTVVGNSAYDLGANTQWHNYSEPVNGLENIRLAANNFGPVAAGGTSVLIKSTFGYYDTQEWIDWVPTVTSGTGAITAYAVTYASYRLTASTVNFQVFITMTNAGTAGASLKVTIPAIFNSKIKHTQGVNAMLIDGTSSAHWPAWVDVSTHLINAIGTPVTGKTYSIWGWYQTGLN